MKRYTVHLTFYSPETFAILSRRSITVPSVGRWLGAKVAGGWDVTIHRTPGWPMVAFDGKADDRLVAGQIVPHKRQER
jgi:hypothetical protein